MDNPAAYEVQAHQLTQQAVPLLASRSPPSTHRFEYVNTVTSGN